MGRLVTKENEKYSRIKSKLKIKMAFATGRLLRDLYESDELLVAYE